ncbi:hypothetical protein BU15DRAFT_77275 [Melanogaster broomeanus]|nr:hypothetical protein BU15DRAFT_77275 [Melanogaster broomeanus]
MASGGSYEGQEGERTELRAQRTRAYRLIEVEERKSRTKMMKTHPQHPPSNLHHPAPQKYPTQPIELPNPPRRRGRLKHQHQQRKRHQQWPQRQQQRPPTARNGKGSNGIGRQWQLQRWQHEWLQQGQLKAVMVAQTDGSSMNGGGDNANNPGPIRNGPRIPGECPRHPEVNSEANDTKPDTPQALSSQRRYFDLPYRVTTQA